MSKKMYRTVTDRVMVPGKRYGETYVLTLECRHSVKKKRQEDGHKLKRTHCEKCALGLVAA